MDVGVCVVYPRDRGGKGKDGDGGKVGGKGDKEEGNGEEGGSVCGEEWQGVIRREDVRATEKDRVDCKEGFRVGDVVRGVVVCANFLLFISVSFGDGLSGIVER